MPGVRVIIKFRPMNKVEAGNAAEDNSKTQMIIQHEKNTIVVGGKDMVFDRVLDPQTTQEGSFEAIGQEVCEELLNGFNSTIFVYGQTGAGKTYTMYGDDGSTGDTPVEKLGMIPRCTSFLFEKIEAMKDPASAKQLLDWKMAVSFVEIYNVCILHLSRSSVQCLRSLSRIIGFIIFFRKN